MEGNPFEKNVLDMRPPDLTKLIDWIYEMNDTANGCKLEADFMWLLPDMAENRYIYRYGPPLSSLCEGGLRLADITLFPLPSKLVRSAQKCGKNPGHDDTLGIKQQVSQ